MNRNQNERIRNLEKPIPGCLGRMVNLFDLNTSIGSGNKLLTEKPHYEGSPVSRCQSDLMNNKMILSELKQSPSNRKSNMTPIKMLIAQEMSKEECPKQSPPNLVAKLMGLDALPQPHQCRSNLGGLKSRSHSGSLDFIQKEEHNEIKINQKDVFEIWQKGRYNKESKNEKNMALVREKFMEAKRLSTDEKLRQSKQFQDALEVLSSNKDLFLKFLQEPNSLFSHHHQNLQSLPSHSPPPPPPESRRITVLKPSKFLDGHKLTGSGKQNGKQINSWDNPNPNQPTRIVVLKPSSGKIHASPPSSRTDDGFYGDLEDMEPPESRISKPESPGGDRRGESRETLLSSVFSNGYIGDESSFSKSEVYYAAGNLSDSEAMSPISRHSWDYINRFGSPYSSSSFTYSPESSSVCREAKKRLSERWAIMSFQEQRNIRRSSSTLGEMLALSDTKKSVESEEKFSDLNNKGQDYGDCSPKSLVRSKSCGSRLGEVTESSKVKKDENTKELTKDKSGKSSLFKGLFFSKSRKSSSKQKSQKDDDRKIGDDESQCINDINESSRKEEHLPEVGFSVTKPEIIGNANENQEQPSPISVLELELEDDEYTTGYSRSAKLKEHGVDPIKFNLLDKSPPIGSIARTLSWDESPVGPTKTSSPEEEEQEYFLYVQALLSVAGINGNSPENPLPPSLRDTYIKLTGNNHPVSKQRHQRSTQRLVFDCVNEALVSGTPLDHVWDRVKEWRQCGGDGEEDGGSWAVRKEVVAEMWAEMMRLEVDDIKKEIEEMLVEELVEELF